MECSIKDFILTSYLEDISICDQIIEYHKISNDKFSGQSYSVSSNAPVVNKDIKDSTDVTLEFNTMLWKKYSEQLQNVVNMYMDIFVYAGITSRWRVTETVNIQHYKPNGGFKTWHAERTSHIFPIVNRHLVFMTYLNDVYDAGETEFFYQKFKVQPRKGLTVIWPADWTHTHRGIPSPTEEKYIVTGWFNFTEQ